MTWRPSRGGLVLAAMALLWLALDRPWTVRPLQAPDAALPFDAARYVDTIWSSRVVPTIESGAVQVGRFDEIAASAGVRALPVTFDGLVVSVDTSSRVGVALVDAEPFDGRPDLSLQVGPVLRGTALRDALPFVQFSDFSNQIQFAAVASALNDRVLSDTLRAIDRASLERRRVRGVGVVSRGGASDVMPSVLPVRLEVENLP